MPRRPIRGTLREIVATIISDYLENANVNIRGFTNEMDIIHANIEDYGRVANDTRALFSSSGLLGVLVAQDSGGTRSFRDEDSTFRQQQRAFLQPMYETFRAL